MRKLLILMGLLMLAVPAWASTYYDTDSIGSVLTTGTASVNTVSPNYAKDLILMGCADVTAANAITPVQSGWTAITGSPKTNATTWGGAWTRTISGSEPGAYTATGTNTDSIKCSLFYLHQDGGGTPIVDISAGSGTGTTPAAVTTTVANDVLLWLTMGPWQVNTSTSALPAAGAVLGNQSTLSMNLLYAGQLATGASITPTITYAGGGAPVVFTLALENNTTTAASAIGIGADSNNGGSAGSVAPVTPSNAGANDTNFAFIVEKTNTGIAIQPPGQNGVAGTTLAFAAKSATGAFVINAGATAGDLVVSCAYSGSTLTPPSGFIHMCDNAANFAESCDYKVIVGGDIGATETYTGGSPNSFYTDWNNASGVGWAIDTNSLCGSSGNANNANAPALTTQGANETVLVATNQGGAGTVTKPAGTTLAISGAPANNSAGYLAQAVAGAVATQNFTSTINQTWEMSSIGIIRTDGTGPWTKYGSAIVNPGASLELDTYYARGLAASLTQRFVFTTKPALSDGFIVDFGNLNVTTPIDVAATKTADTSVSGPIWPAITPRNDELLLRAGALATVNGENGLLVNLIVGGGGDAGIGPVSNPAQVTSLTSNDGAYANETLGLDSGAQLTGGWFPP